jgi:predicted DNA binding CopG/RHH family protein
MNRKKKRWSDKEIAVYHDAMSEEELVQQIERADWKPVGFAVERSRARPGSIMLPPDIVATVKRIAQKQGVNYQTLLQQWIQERLDKELSLHQPIP